VASVAQQPSALIGETLLVRPWGGAIEARETPGGWVAAQALYRVELTLDEPLPLAPRAWRGHAVFKGEQRSLWARVWRTAEAAWVREAGF